MHHFWIMLCIDFFKKKILQITNFWMVMCVHKLPSEFQKHVKSRLSYHIEESKVNFVCSNSLLINWESLAYVE